MAVLAGTSACEFSSAAKAKTASYPQQSGVWVEVAPSTVPAGSTVTVRANCLDNGSSATVTSTAFGTTATVVPNNTVLVAEVVIPPNVNAGQHTVTVTCHNGSSASTTITIVNGVPAGGPHTGGGFLASGQDGTGINPGLVWLAASVGTLALAGAAMTLRRRKRNLAER